MTDLDLPEEDQRDLLIKNWQQKAHEALESARLLSGNVMLEAAVNRAYYACFYSLYALLSQEGLAFKKHSGVRSWLHRALVQSGKLEPPLGKLYDRLFVNRHRADYHPFVQFEQRRVEEMVEQAAAFVAAIERLVQFGQGT